MLNLSFDAKNIILPVIIFYIIDVVVIHENKGLLPVYVPVLSKLLNGIYSIFSAIIYKDLHSKPLAHAVVFLLCLIVSLYLVDNNNLFYLKNKKINIDI